MGIAHHATRSPLSEPRRVAAGLGGTFWYLTCFQTMTPTAPTPSRPLVRRGGRRLSSLHADGDGPRPRAQQGEVEERSMSELCCDTLPDLPQVRTLQRIVPVIWSHAEVVAIWVGGRFASGHADIYSDGADWGQSLSGE